MRWPHGPELVRRLGLVIAPVAAVAAYMLLGSSTLTDAGRLTAAMGVLMAVWWLTEAIPISATALVPLVVIPLGGVGSIKSAAAPFADPIIFLFLGGFLLGAAMERSNLHRRIALLTLLAVGNGPRAIIAGLMIATGMLSAWVSNSATAAMMLPIALGVVRLITDQARQAEWPAESARNFATCAVLGVAYAASIGGVATLIGSPPNAVLAGFVMETYGQKVDFMDWMAVGLPAACVMMPLAWAALVLVVYPIRGARISGGRELVARELAHLGPVTAAQAGVLIIFVVTASAWVSRGLLPDGLWPKVLTDDVIAVTAGVALFIVRVPTGEPGRRSLQPLLHAEDLERIPWTVLVLFGGGLSLAAAVKANGVDAFVGGGFASLGGLPTWMMVLTVAAVMIFLTELTSNTAVTTTMLPVLAGAAAGIAIEPRLLLYPAALGASLAFMLPVGTPPNAMAYATGHVSIARMARAGMVLNLVSIVAVTAVCLLLVPAASG